VSRLPSKPDAAGRTGDDRLVKSQNSKVIVVGNAKNGLPLMYAGEK
jgi:hypothetical protein